MASPLIIPYQSQAGIRTASAGAAAQMRGAGEFLSPGAANLGQGIQRLASGIQDLNNAVASVELRKRQELMELDLLNDLQAFQSASQAWMDDYKQQNQGRNAVNAASAADAFFAGQMADLRQKWQGNNRALLYIERHAGGFSLSGLNSMRNYGNQQQEVYKDSTFAGRKQIFLDTASDWRSTPQDIENAYRDFAPKYSAYLISKGLDPTSARTQADRIYRDAMSERAEQVFLGKYGAGKLEEAQAALDGMKSGDAAGFTAQFESGPAGSLAIGHDSSGGTSYGKYQIASKPGTFNNWLQWLDRNGHGNVADALRSAGPADTGSREGKMPEVWRQLVRAGAITEDMQRAFIQETHVAPGLEKLPDNLRAAVNADPTLARAFFSTAVQHGPGGAAKLFSRNWEKAGDDREAFLDALYTDRKTQFSGLSEEERQAVMGRLDRERSVTGTALVSPEKLLKYEEMLRKATLEKLKSDSIQKYGALPPDKAAVAALQDPALAAHPQVQRNVVEFFDWQMRHQERQEKQARIEQLNRSYEAIAAAAENRDMREVNRIIMSAAPENMSKLQSYANRVVNGDGLISDPVAFDDMIDRIASGDPVQIDAEYGDVLSLQDLRRGKSALARRDLAEYRVREKAAFDEEALKYKEDIKAGEQSALFRRFEASIPEGGFRDPAQRQKALTAFWRKITIDRPWSFSKDIRGFEEKEYAAKGYFPSKGLEYQQLVAEARAQIKERDGVEREPTEEEIARLYRQIHGVEEEDKK